VNQLVQLHGPWKHGKKLEKSWWGAAAPHPPVFVLGYVIQCDRHNEKHQSTFLVRLLTAEYGQRYIALFLH